MEKNERRKVKKFWRDRVVLTVGIIGSLCLFVSGGVKGYQTYKQNPVPQRILDTPSELELLLENLTLDNKSLAERQIIIKKIEKIAKENQLGCTRIASWTASHVLQLEQALSSKHDLPQAELRQLLQSLQVSLSRSFRNEDFIVYTSWLS